MTNYSESARTAENLILVRDLRADAFPNDIFDEHAWNMLLRLFVAHAKGQDMSESDLIRATRTPVGVGQRWLAHLVGDAQIEAYADGAPLALTRPAVDRMHGFLLTASRVHRTDGAT